MIAAFLRPCCCVCWCIITVTGTVNGTQLSSPFVIPPAFFPAMSSQDAYSASPWSLFKLCLYISSQQQKGPATCSRSAQDERRRPAFDRKTYLLSWLNPVGLLNQNPGLIAKMNNTDVGTEASKIMDTEREYSGKLFCNKKMSFLETSSL